LRNGSGKRAAEFADGWSEFLKTVEEQLQEIDPEAEMFNADRYQRIVRMELNKWFQPEHGRGAWMRDFSASSPEAAATLRQRLTEIRLPDRNLTLALPYWTGLLLYGGSVAAIALALRMLSASTIWQVAGIALAGLIVWPIAVALWKRIRRKRHRRAIAGIRKALEVEGERLAVILDDL
jgi:hypothetical protein